MTAYAGKAALTLVKTTDGRMVNVYAGYPVPDNAVASEVDRLLDGGFIVEVDPSEVGGLPNDDPNNTLLAQLERAAAAGGGSHEAKDGTGEPPAEPPAKSALKDEWVAYAVSQGADEAEAAAMNKDDLIAAYGAS